MLVGSIPAVNFFNSVYIHSFADAFGESVFKLYILSELNLCHSEN